MSEHVTGIRKINLLPGRSKLQIRSLRFKEPNRRFTAVVMFLWFFCTMLTLSIYWYFNQRLSASRNKLVQAQSEYKQYSNVVLATSKIRFVAKQIAEVLSSRFEYSKAFAAFSQLFDQNTTISNFELKDNKYFEVGGLASNAEAMQRVEQLVDKINKGGISEFKWAKIKGISYAQDYSWNFSLEIGL